MTFFGFEYTEVNPTSLSEAHSLLAKHDFDFPNLPYLIDGDVKLTESLAIPFYLSQKAKNFDFYGKPGIEQSQHFEILGVLADIREAIVQIVLSDNYNQVWFAKMEFFIRKFGYLAKFLVNKEFLFEKISLADFLLWGVVRFLEKVMKALKVDSIFEELPVLTKHAENIEALPQLKDYFASDTFKKRVYVSEFMTKLKLE